MEARVKWNSKYIERLNDLIEPVPNTRLENLAPYLTGSGFGPCLRPWRK